MAAAGRASSGGAGGSGDAVVEAGMDVARLNFSHGAHADHATAYRRVREASDATGHAVDSSLQYAHCMLEVPLHVLNAVGKVRVRVTGCDSVLRIDATVQPRATRWECPWGQWFSVDSNKCESCGQECSPGFRPQACEALSGTADCVLCPDPPEHALHVKRCEWQCVDGFWLEPHVDIPVKLFTMLVYLSGEPELQDAGTDIYDATPQHNRVGTASYERNKGLIFIPGKDTWHGFSPRPIGGVRKSIIINYVASSWRDTFELA